MPAAPLIVAAAVSSGVAATIGTAVVGTIVAGTVSTAVATAVGAGIISGGITAISGGSVSDVLKSAVIGGVTSGVGAYVGGAVAGAVSKAANAAGYTTIAGTLGTIAGNTVGGGVASALGAAAYGADPVEALIKGGLTAGITSGVMESVGFATSKIDGFDKLPGSVQRATQAALASGALGKDPKQALASSFLEDTSKYLGKQLKDYGNELKAAYQAAKTKGAALENNGKRQSEIVNEYTTVANNLNSSYDKVQVLTKDANDAIAAFEKGGKTQELADVANAKVKTANDFIATFDSDYTNGKAQLDRLSAELDTLKTALPEQEKAFLDSKVALEDTTKLFQEQEARNADLLVKTTQDVEVASKTLKNDLGIDISEDLIKDFVESGDVNNATSAYVTKTNQTAQSYGFDNYKDQTAALENDFNLDQAADWNQYKDTAGVVEGIAPGVGAVGLGGQTDIANVFEPEPFASAEPAYDEAQFYGPSFPVDEQLAETGTFEPEFDFYTPTAPLGEQVATGVQEQPFSYTADELYQDVASGYEPLDFASYLEREIGPTTYATEAVPEPAIESFGDLLGAPTQVAKGAPPVEPREEPDLISSFLDDYYRQQEQPATGDIQVAALSPSMMPGDTMTDVGLDDAGLQALFDRQQAQAAPEEPAGAITDRGLSDTESATDLSAVTPGSATYSALTGTDPTKTITGSVLGEDTGDVRGGIESSALYSGTEEEFAPSDLVAGKYFAEKPEEKRALEDVGLTSTETQRPEESALLASATPSSSSYTGDFRTTLPVSSGATQTQRALEGTTMDDDFDPYYGLYRSNQSAGSGASGFPVDDDLMGRYVGSGASGFPVDAGFDLVDSGVPDYGDGFVRNLTDESQEFQTENGKVIYYDDGRIATIGNDGRYVMYGADGSVVDYADINDPKARVQTFGPGAGGVPGVTYEGGKAYRGNPPSLLDRMAAGITKQFTDDPLRFLTVAGGALAGATSKRKGVQPRGLQSLQGLQGVSGGGAQLAQTGAQGTKGRGGVRYFERKAEGGAISGYAGGGGLGYLKSAHDGMADKIDATIDNKRPAKLSGGEFVIPADVVSHLGNGNSEAGAKQLYDLMERVRKARTGTPKQGKQISPKKYLPK